MGLKIQKKYRGAFFPAIIFWLVSCATTQKPNQNVSPVYVTNRVTYTLLSPDHIEAPLDMAQQISGVYGGQEMLLDAWVQADRGGISIALINSFGVSMGDLSFTGDAISFSSSMFPPSFKAEYVAADFQFCFYRIDALVPALRGLSLVVEIRDTPDGSVEVRRIFDKKKLIIEIEKKPDEVRYTNVLRGYAYTLRGDFR
ncbi:DUF3261 domain-containing protein [Treponema primitia]|uniref:DUF3261 domain-containing protein n=1 Tax=Treponema primitia TaxID=88058 RepID=UPI0002554F2E|nr:DUF3261 domain-containing protein [Treponema primitia]